MDEGAILPGQHLVIDPMLVHRRIEIDEDLPFGAYRKLYPVLQVQLVRLVQEQVSPLRPPLLLRLVQAHELEQVSVQQVRVLRLVVAPLVVKIRRPKDLEKIPHRRSLQRRHAPPHDREHHVRVLKRLHQNKQL